MTEKEASVVRSGWGGHEPVEVMDRFIPFLREHGFAVRIAGSPKI